MEPENIRRLVRLAKDLKNLLLYNKDLEAEEEDRKQGREYAQWVQRLCEGNQKREEHE